MSDEGGAVPWNFQHPFYYNVIPESDLWRLIFGALTFEGRIFPSLSQTFLQQNAMWWRKLSSNWIACILLGELNDCVYHNWLLTGNKTERNFKLFLLKLHLIMKNFPKFCLYLRCNCFNSFMLSSLVVVFRLKWDHNSISSTCYDVCNGSLYVFDSFCYKLNCCNNIAEPQNHWWLEKFVYHLLLRNSITSIELKVRTLFR